jgi:hypothetical protein
MKKTVLSFLLTLTITSSLFSLPNRFYSLKTKMPASLKELGSVPVYYKGHKIDLAQGWAKLPECGEPCTFSLLITENVDFSAKGNTVRYLKRIKEQPYTWYDLTLNFHNERPEITENDPDTTPAPAKTTYSWDIEQHDSSETPERIPEHTIVLLTNPTFIESLKTEPSLPGDIVLPTIVFKDGIDTEEYKESSLNILLGPVVNLDAIHRKDSPTCMTRKDAVVMSATKQNYETH